MSTDDSDGEYQTTRRNAMKAGAGTVLVPLSHESQSWTDKVRSWFGDDNESAGTGENVYVRVNEEVITEDTKAIDLQGYGVSEAVEKNKHSDEGVAVVTFDVDDEDIAPRSASPDKVSITEWGEHPDYVVYERDSTIRARNGRTGEEDFTGSDLAAVINSCLGQLGANEGLIAIQSRDGPNYRVNESIQVDGNRVEIRGYGGMVQIMQDDGANLSNGIIHAPSTNNQQWLTLSGLILNGNKANNTSGKGVYCAGDGADWEINRFYVKDCPGKGIYMEQPFGVRIRNLIVEQCNDIAVDLGGDKRNFLSHCKINKNKHGILVSSNESKIVECEFIQNEQRGVWISGNDTEVVSCLFVGNGTASTGSHPQLFVGSSVERTKVAASSFKGSGTSQYGVSLNASSSKRTAVDDSCTFQGHTSDSINNPGGTFTRRAGVVSDSYTGDGTTGRTIELGFRPSVVYVEGSDGTLYEVRDGGVGAINGSAPSGELSVSPDGFTVGDGGADADPNTGTETYQFEAY